MSVYELTSKSLGKGSFGEVILAKNYTNNTYEAAKKLPKKIGKVELENLTNEILISTSFVNPHIIKINEIFEADRNEKYLMFEYCDGGDLKRYLNKYKQKFGKPFPEQTIQIILYQVLDGLACLHRNSIIHVNISFKIITSSMTSNQKIFCFNSRQTRIRKTSTSKIAPSKSLILAYPNLKMLMKTKN